MFQLKETLKTRRTTNVINIVGLFNDGGPIVMRLELYNVNEELNDEQWHSEEKERVSNISWHHDQRLHTTTY